MSLPVNDVLKLPFSEVRVMYVHNRITVCIKGPNITCCTFPRLCYFPVIIALSCDLVFPAPM